MHGNWTVLHFFAESWLRRKRVQGDKRWKDGMARLVDSADRHVSATADAFLVADRNFHFFRPSIPSRRWLPAGPSTTASSRRIFPLTTPAPASNSACPGCWAPRPPWTPSPKPRRLTRPSPRTGSTTSSRCWGYVCRAFDPTCWPWSRSKGPVTISMFIDSNFLLNTCSFQISFWHSLVGFNGFSFSRELSNRQCIFFLLEILFCSSFSYLLELLHALGINLPLHANWDRIDGEIFTLLTWNIGCQIWFCSYVLQGCSEETEGRLPSVTPSPESRENVVRPSARSLCEDSRLSAPNSTVNFRPIMSVLRNLISLSPPPV